jgi:hypothetical protein
MGLKHFNFVGDSVPQGPLANGTGLCRPTAKVFKKLKCMRTRRRLCEPLCRRRGLTGVYPCVKKVLEYTHTYIECLP